MSRKTSLLTLFAIAAFLAVPPSLSAQHQHHHPPPPPGHHHPPTHGPQPCVFLSSIDGCIDGDGIASPGHGFPAALDTPLGAPLRSFPVTGAADAGLDMFDQDANQDWTRFGRPLPPDDLHAEDPNTCPTAIRDGDHDLGLDCKVLDLNGNLANQEPVDCDLEVGFSFSGMPCPPPRVKWHDTNGDQSWDSGEDIILDANLNGVFD